MTRDVDQCRELYELAPRESVDLIKGGPQSSRFDRVSSLAEFSNPRKHQPAKFTGTAGRATQAWKRLCWPNGGELLLEAGPAKRLLETPEFAQHTSVVGPFRGLFHPDDERLVVAVIPNRIVYYEGTATSRGWDHRSCRELLWPEDFGPDRSAITIQNERSVRHNVHLWTTPDSVALKSARRIKGLSVRRYRGLFMPRDEAKLPSLPTRGLPLPEPTQN